MFSIIRISLAVALMAVTAQGFAQETPNKQVASYIWSPEIQRQLYAMAVYMDKEILGREPCQSKVWLEPISFGFLQPLEFSTTTPHPIKGLWTFRYRFDRCGESTYYNALFQAKENGSPNIIPLVPGLTRASPLLMRDTFTTVAIAAAIKNKDSDDCAKKVKIINTTITVNPHLLTANNEQFDGAWEEEWTVKTCSPPVVINVCFLPNKNSGGTSMVAAKCQDQDTIKSYLSSPASKLAP